MAKPSLASTKFGQTKFGHYQVWSDFVVKVGGGGGEGGEEGWFQRSGLTPGGVAVRVGPRSGGEGARRVVSRRVGGPKFRVFSPLPPQFSFVLPSFGVFSWNLGSVLRAGTLKCARLEFWGCRVKPRRLSRLYEKICVNCLVF